MSADNQQARIRSILENAFLRSFDQAIESTSESLLETGIAEEMVWRALDQALKTLQQGIESVDANRLELEIFRKNIEKPDPIAA